MRKHYKIELDKNVTITWPHWFWHVSTFGLLLIIAALLGYVAWVVMAQALGLERAGEWVKEAMQ